jgi:UV radiation resistance-associated gene protein
MADRDLRALDMRHTLPNLKNLLLTLTDGEGTRLLYALPNCFI